MKKRASDSLKKFCGGLKQAKSFLLASHVNPEGDAVACVLAMDSLLRRLGKKILIACEDPFPERLSVLPSKRWNQAKDISPDRHFDALLVCDCPTLERIGKTMEFVHPEMSIFNIDHHMTNHMFGTHNYVQPKAAACGEVVYDIFKYFESPISKAEATYLYVSISTDTGSFKYSNTNVKSHKIASELIQKGLDIEKINDSLYATYSLHKMKLYSRLMDKVRTEHQGDIAWVGMTRRDLEETGATYEDTEGFIDFLKYIREVKYAFFMSENASPNNVRISFRSKGNHDVSKIAAKFGGGGHQKASGCTIQASMGEAAKKILHEIYKEVDGHLSS